MRHPATALVPASAAALAAGCAEGSALDPAGPQAARIADVWWLVLVLGTVVFLAVLGLLLVPLLRARRLGATDPTDDRPEGEDADEPARRRLMFGTLIAAPLVILVVVAAGSVVGPTVAHHERAGELVVEVTGHMFWWEVHYPELDVVTANEIHVPVGTPVRLRMRSTDVIHSFWVPPIHGKIDLRPGAETSLSFDVSRPGTYRGRCAEYCGLSHAQMGVLVVAQEPADFQAWAQQQAAPAGEPGSAAARRGRDLFASAGCAECHAVRGHTAVGEVGPDLTHLASRRTIAATTLDNQRDRLAAWILDPHVFKPGVPMPPSTLSDAEVEALLDYLEGLE